MMDFLVLIVIVQIPVLRTLVIAMKMAKKSVAVTYITNVQVNVDVHHGEVGRDGVMVVEDARYQVVMIVKMIIGRFTISN